MAASDPTPSVPTPTGTLAGLAAFPWDGSAWQPTGRAVPSVATPTGVLRGVAPFAWDGSNWQPVGAAKPSVATPSGVLDGVALYTWSGSAWAPSGGVPDVATPSGTLQGVAAFYWDGTNWQPSGQAAPEIATPSGVLMGAAMFGWNGAAWTAAPSLDLNFLTGALDSRITFTRASVGTYFDATGTLQTAANNVARFDHDPVTLAAKGLLIEEARANQILQSADVSNAAWAKGGAPTVTANQAVAPDGTTTAARIDLPTVTGTSFSQVNQSFTETAAVYCFSVWLRGVAGGERVYLMATPNAVLYYSTPCVLTTAWQRFTLITSALTAVPWFFQLGFDRRDAAQTVTNACSFYAWGGQVELGPFATSTIPTTSASVTRAADVATMAVGSWYTAGKGTLASEAMMPVAQAAGTSPDIVSLDDGTNNNRLWLYVSSPSTSVAFMANGGATQFNTATGAITLGATFRQAVAFTGGAQAFCANGGSVGTASIATIPTFNRLAFGLSNGNAYIRRVRYWPRALSSTELQQATT